MLAFKSALKSGPRTRAGAHTRAWTVPANGCRIASLRAVRRHVIAAAAPARPPQQDRASVLAQLKALEHERDEAVAAAEACSKTVVKLEEMARLLQQLALEKVRSGDEAAAREVLVERKGVTEALERNMAKADANYALARKLAVNIAQCQTQLVESVRPPAAMQGPTGTSSPSPVASGSWSSASAAAMPEGAAASVSSGPGAGSRWRWEQSLEEARQRLAAQESTARAEGLRARRSAEETIAEARARIREKTEQDVAQAQARLRQATASSQGSLEEAQARLRARDEEVLRYVRRVVSRYRRE